MQRFWVSLLGLAFLAGCATSGGSNAGDDQAMRNQISAALAKLNAEGGAPAENGERFVDPGTKMAFEVRDYDHLAGWNEDDHGAALGAFRTSCDKIRRLDSTMVLGGMASHIEDWRPSCDAADDVNEETARLFFELAFTPVRISPDDHALITAYYEPELEARRKPDGEFRFPLLAKPDEVVHRGGRYGVVRDGQVRPYLTRGEIDKGALHGRNLEIAYLNDAVDAFFLHVQGSGRLRFDNGEVQRVAFAAKNGHDYSSAGRAMMRAGVLTPAQATADGIKDYVRANPERGQQFLAANKSYIFFREVMGLDEQAGPEGALGVQLMDGRSIAIDRRYTPLGAPVWLEADASPTGPIKRLVVAQDTGSAIKGAQRADLFWGSGAEAGSTAGRMKHKGALTVLLPTATVKRLIDAGS